MSLWVVGVLGVAKEVEKGVWGNPPNALIMPAAVQAGSRLGGAFLTELGPSETAGACGKRARAGDARSTRPNHDRRFYIKVSPEAEENQARLARIERLRRAMAAHRHPAPPQVLDEREPDAYARALRRMPSLPCFPQGDRWPASLPKSLPCPILRSGLWLPPVARLALGPLGRRNPAARTLTLALRAVCQHGLPMPPWRGPALGSASSSRSGLAGAASPG